MPCLERLIAHATETQTAPRLNQQLTRPQGMPLHCTHQRSRLTRGAEHGGSVELNGIKAELLLGHRSGQLLLGELEQTQLMHTLTTGTGGEQKRLIRLRADETVDLVGMAQRGHDLESVLVLAVLEQLHLVEVRHLRRPHQEPVSLPAALHRRQSP